MDITPNDLGGETEPNAAPTEGVGIKCVVCGARPFADCWPEKPRETFDLLKIDGEWRCKLHRARQRQSAAP
jgi:hypothetical protein